MATLIKDICPKAANQICFNTHPCTQTLLQISQNSFKCDCVIILRMLMFVIVALSLLQIAASVGTASPFWVADSNFRAGTFSLISSVTSSPYTNTYTVFYSTALTTNPPLLAIGLKSYQGNDYLLQQFFQLSMNPATDSLPSKFKVTLTLSPITTPIILEISYIAIESNYPYVNAFTFLNFGGASLINISTISSSKQTQTEIINYKTGQYFNSLSAAPSTFSTPLSENKIAFFLSALFITSTSTEVVEIDVDYGIIDSNSYWMSVTAGKNLSITKIAFSKFIYNTKDYSLGARNYLTSYDWKITNPLTTSTFSIPTTILNNQLIVGIKSFYTASGQDNINFQWNSGTFSSYNGVQLTAASFSSYVVQVLYYLEWTCPAGFPYTNFVTFLCQDSCAPYEYPDPVDLVCKPCSNTLCYTCSGANRNVCTSCATNYALTSGTCDCDMSANSKILVSNSICYICSNLQTQCTLCDYTGSSALPYDATQFTCLDCNDAAGYFINPSNVCVLCTLANCQTCASLSTCSVCNTGYGVNALGICSTCPLSNCTACYNTTACKTCNSPYILLNYNCTSCPVSCACGGYTLPRKTNGDCSTICGDGLIIAPYQLCDDNNTLDGDGCSSSCQIEANSSCSGQPSTCHLTINFNATLISMYAVFANCNQIVFNFQLTPYIPFFKLYPANWTKLIQAQTSAISLLPDSFSQNQGNFSLTYMYNQTIQKTNIDFTFTPSAIITTPPYLSQTSPFNVTVNVDPSNNLAAVYCSTELITKTSILPSYFTAQSSIAYIGLFLSVFSLKIVGLEMFGALQVSYLILSDYDYINPVFRQILGRSQVNGINIGQSTQTNPLISDRVVYNGFASENFLDNFNVMFYITLGLTFTGFAMYSITYMINKTIEESKLNDSLKEQSLQSQHSKNQVQDKEKEKQPKSIMLHRFSKYLLKQVLMTFIIFNMFNMSFSAGLQMKYVNIVQPSSIIAMLVSFMMVIALLLSQIITDKLQFGQYINKFNQQTSQSNYMIVTALYRFTLGLLMALLNDWSESGIVFTFISGAFLTYIFYCEPFVDEFQNLRSKAIHCVHVLIMFINYYYRQEVNFDEVQASSVLFPAYLQIAVVGFVVFGSSIMLGYELFIKIKKMITQGKQAVDQGQNIFSGMQAENPVQQIQTIEAQQM